MQNLNYDPQGFIIGLGRVERQTSLLHDDTQTIIRILSSQATINQTQLTDINQRLQRLNQTTKASNNPRNRQTRMVGEQTQSHTRLDTAREIGSTTNTPVRQHQNRQNTPNTERLRDSHGRFTTQAEEISFIQKLSDTVAKNVADVGVDDRNLDPLVESMHEVYDTVKPMGKMLGLMWRMGAWTKNKIFAQKRNEPLSQAQEQHNRTVEEHLENIADNGRRGGLLGLLAKMLMGGLGLLMAGGKGALKLLKKGGKGLGVLGALFGVGNLVHDWDNKSHEEKSSGIGAVGGGVAGAMAGASIGSVILPGVGTVVGGLLGGWLGSEGGEALGKTASPYLERWTNGLTNYNLADKMQKAFIFGLNPFFSGASAIFEWVKTKAKDLFNINLGDATSGAIPSGDFNAEYSQNPNDTGDSTGGKPNNVAVYEAYRKAGLSHEQALGITAEVGREGDFANKNIFGYHTDAAKDKNGNNITNIGMLSWNRERADRLKAHLNTKGLLQNGKMVQSQATIDAMAEFSVSEMKGAYKGKLGNFWANPHDNPENYAKELGKNYVGWAYGQNKLRGGASFDWKSHDNRRRGHLNKTASMVTGKSITSNQKNNNQSNKLEQLASQSGRFGNNRVVVGDSIGVQYNQVHGSDKSTAVNGQNPSQVLGQIQSLIKTGTINKGTEVVLSSGLSNAMNAQNSLDLVKQQLQTLQKTGANVRLFGVADNFNNNTKLGSLTNKELQTYAQAYGATFEGGFNYNPSDKYKAHPANRYFDGKGWKLENIAQAKAPNVSAVNIPKPPTITQKLSTEKSDIVTASSQSQIPQNVSDKSLAYAITGGLGGERFLG